ncbi:surface-adhesin E family protein [Moraxella sp. FZLJ2109]|uniref:surface-adhesin E family protein n=1 Tax=unclassified Moraxella TaxID=2685852 RepID=UPI0035321B30
MAKKFWTTKYFEYFDCRARKSDIEYGATYDKQGRVVDSGNMSSFSRYSSANWKRAIPGTPSETLLNTVCAYAN